MKYIKTFENINQEPEVGDYVTFKGEAGEEKLGDNFIKDKIGKIKAVNSSNIKPNRWNTWYSVKFKGDKNLYFYRLSDIDCFFKTQEDAESYLAEKKYNI